MNARLLLVDGIVVTHPCLLEIIGSPSAAKL